MPTNKFEEGVLLHCISRTALTFPWISLAGCFTKDQNHSKSQEYLSENVQNMYFSKVTFVGSNLGVIIPDRKLCVSIYTFAFWCLVLGGHLYEVKHCKAYNAKLRLISFEQWFFSELCCLQSSVVGKASWDAWTSWTPPAGRSSRCGLFLFFYFLSNSFRL